MKVRNARRLRRRFATLARFRMTWTVAEQVRRCGSTGSTAESDYIAEAASHASDALREAIEHRVAVAHEAFRRATVEDDAQRLGRYFRVDRVAAIGTKGLVGRRHWVGAVAVR